MRLRAPLLALLLIALSCSRERTVIDNTRKHPAPRVQPPPVVPATRESAPSHSTPARCAGDGSYLQAVDCFRIASTLAFAFDDGNGKLERPTPGRERVSIVMKRKGDAGAWVAEVAPRGVVWTRDGASVKAVPPRLMALYQRVTIFPDPQKKEGSAQKIGSAGGLIEYSFTDANNGDRYGVWVNASDGSIGRLAINGRETTFSR